MNFITNSLQLERHEFTGHSMKANTASIMDNHNHNQDHFDDPSYYGGNNHPTLSDYQEEQQPFQQVPHSTHPPVLHMMNNSSYSSPSSSSSSITQNNPQIVNNRSIPFGTNSNSSSSASSISSTHRQFPSYGSADFSSSNSEPVTPPDNRFSISGFTPTGKAIASTGSATTAVSSGISSTMYNMFPMNGDNHGFTIGGPLLTPQGDSIPRNNHLQYQQGLNLGNMNLAPVASLASPPIDRVNGTVLPVTMPPLPKQRLNSHQPHVITPPSDSSSTIHASSSSSTTVTDDFISDMNRLSVSNNVATTSNSFPSSGRYLFDGEVHSYSPPPTSANNNGNGISLATSSAAAHQRKPSFLQAETTDDKFPILVRRESNGFKTSPGIGSSSRQSFSGAIFDFLDPSPILSDSTNGGVGGYSPNTGAGWTNGSQGNNVGNGPVMGTGLGSMNDTSFGSVNTDANIYLQQQHQQKQYQQQQHQQQHQQQQQVQQQEYQQQYLSRQGIPRSLYYTPPMTSPPTTQGSYFDQAIVPENNPSNYRIVNPNSPNNGNVSVSSVTFPSLITSDNGHTIPGGIAPVSVAMNIRNSSSMSSLPVVSNLPATSTPTKSCNNSQQPNLRIVNNSNPSSNNITAGSRNGRQTKSTSENDLNRYAHANLESMKDEIYALCKDQHGCRFLQRKLEEKNPAYLDMIFNETYPHVVELMTDPFGNYLCQKLLEFATDDQRTVLMRTAAQDLVTIALNQHGTRALQKMIQFINTKEQVELIVDSLKSDVVKLTQDLNGNHVVQKCLYRLSNEGSQFIYDAVGENCVTVGTHKHGCCVLQRCIDHSSPEQKKQLVKEIIKNSYTLVQDQFGNYVAQYVLDLGNKEFSEPMIHQFLGKICILSVQKFSSNVIEKCLRIAEPETASLLIEELVSTPKLDELLRDSYANYVIQTALDYAQPAVRQRLVDNIRPIIPSIRSTPYGRRIQSKLSSGQMTSSNSGSVTPSAVQSGHEFASPVGEFEWPYRS